MPILEVEHISKSFNKTPVLKDVGFNLEKGQAVHHRIFRKWKDNASPLPELSGTSG